MILNITAVKRLHSYLFGDMGGAFSCYLRKEQIMRIKEFTEEIVKGIEERIAGLKAIPTETWRNNGIIQHGITFRKNNERVAPVLYLNQWFKRFNQGELSLQDILEQVIREYRCLPEVDIPDMEEWMASDDFINTIDIRLVNKDTNKKMITARNLVSYELENTDLTCLFYAKVIVEGDAIGEVAISEYLLDRYLPNIANSEALYHEVLKRINTESIRFEPMSNLVNRMVEEVTGEASKFSIKEDFMFILRNAAMTYGATAILTETAKKLILERIPEGKVTVIPSSVHETIIIPTVEDEDVEVLEKLVQQVNKTEISEIDILSNNVYHFDANTGKIEIAHCDEGEVEE